MTRSRKAGRPPAGEKKFSRHISTYVDADTYAKIEANRAEIGLSESAYVRTLILKGLA